MTMMMMMVVVVLVVKKITGGLKLLDGTKQS